MEDFPTKDDLFTDDDIDDSSFFDTITTKTPTHSNQSNLSALKKKDPKKPEEIILDDSTRGRVRHLTRRMSLKLIGDDGKEEKESTPSLTPTSDSSSGGDPIIDHEEETVTDLLAAISEGASERASHAGDKSVGRSVARSTARSRASARSKPLDEITTFSEMTTDDLITSLSFVTDECKSLKKKYESKKAELKYKEKSLVKLAKHMANITEELKGKHSEINSLRRKLRDYEKKEKEDREAKEEMEKNAKKSNESSLIDTTKLFGFPTPSRMLEFGTLCALVLLTATVRK